MGLTDYFAFVVFSQDVQIEKPDRRIFEITAERAGCELAQLLHVGDSLENDVAGARNAGAHIPSGSIVKESRITQKFDLITR